MVLQSFGGGGGCPPGAMRGPPGRVGREGGKTAWGRGLKRAHDEPAELSATAASPPTQKAPKRSGSATAALAVNSGGLGGLGGCGGD